MENSEGAKKRTSYRPIVLTIFRTSLILLPASFPFNLQLSSILTAVLGGTWILLGYYKNLREVFQNRYFLLFALLFLLPFISLFYSDNMDFSLLEKRSFLLIYPLIFFSSRIEAPTLILILRSFIFSCTAAAIYALIMTINSGEVLGTEMTRVHIGITHVYFGWYLTFSIMMAGYLLINNLRFNIFSLILSLVLLFQLFFLFALGSKMAIISLFLLAGIICVRFVIKTRRWKLGAAILLIPAFIFLVTIKSFDVVYYRFYDLFNAENYFVGDNAWNSIGVRVSIFKCISETITHSPFIGSGIGDVQNDLDRCYLGLELPSVAGMNAHNQFLQFVMGTGLVSLIIFLAMFVACAKKSLREKNRPYFFFLFLFLFCSLTESLLERQHGNMFFAFFNSLLFTHILSKDDVRKSAETERKVHT